MVIAPFDNINDKYLLLNILSSFEDILATQNLAGYPLHRENSNKIPCQGKHRELFGNFAKTQKTGNLVCSSCKFHDSKGKRYFNICHENSQFFLKLDMSTKLVWCL